jgi:hypothetical protein
MFSNYPPFFYLLLKQQKNSQRPMGRKNVNGNIREEGEDRKKRSK